MPLIKRILFDPPPYEGLEIKQTQVRASLEKLLKLPSSSRSKHRAGLQIKASRSATTAIADLFRKDLSTVYTLELGTPQEIAEQLTLLEWEYYYCHITRRQLINKTFGKTIGSGSDDISNVMAWINYIDKATYWVVTEILEGRANRVNFLQLPEVSIIYRLIKLRRILVLNILSLNYLV